MRLVITVLIIIYLVGVGVVLSPVVEFDLGQRNGLGLLRRHRAGLAGRLGVAGETRARECEAMTRPLDGLRHLRSHTGGAPFPTDGKIRQRP